MRIAPLLSARENRRSGISRFALERGLIGKIQSLDIQHGSAYSWPVQTLEPFQKENGGLLADMGVHYLDLAECGPSTSRFSAEKAPRLLGWVPHVDLAEGQRRTIEYLQYMHLWRGETCVE